MSGIPSTFSGLNIHMDLDDVDRAYVREGIMGKGISFKRKDDEDEEVLVFQFPYDLRTFLEDLDEKVTKAITNAQTMEKAAQKKLEEATLAYNTAEKRAMETVKEQANKWAKEYKKKCDDTIQKSVAERDDAITKMQETARKNENLLRIQREKANAQRGLVPKKKRSGYILIDTGHATYRKTYEIPRVIYQKGKPVDTEEKITKTDFYECYRSMFESPINVLIDEDTALEEIYKAYNRGYWGDSQNKEPWGYSDSETISEILTSDRLRIFDWELKPCMKTGLWRITIWHNNSLSPITENIAFPNIPK